PKAVWKDRDIHMLLDRADRHKAEGGDGMNFSETTWKKISPWVDSVRVTGGEKSWTSCKAKWHALRKTLELVELLAHGGGGGASGFTWSPEHGANITPADEPAWAAFVKAHPEAEQFRNKGWPFYEKMAALIPHNPKGQRV
ncbi:hypothetical protein OH76DRAFT_1321152, partial [Lentinus brumalis]